MVEFLAFLEHLDLIFSQQSSNIRHFMMNVAASRSQEDAVLVDTLVENKLSRVLI